MTDNNNHEDVFDKVDVPTWVDLQEANVENGESDDSFFPDSLETEDVTEEPAQVALEEDPEDFSRLTMFGNRRQIKRRSQIRREQEVADNKSTARVRPADPPKRAASRNRLSNISQPEMRNPVIAGNSGPTTRSQSRAIPTISASIPPAIHGNQRNEGTVKRVPVMVKARPIIAFGSIVRQKLQERRPSIIRSHQELPTPNINRSSSPDRTPTATSAARSLTDFQTPVMGTRQSNTDSVRTPASVQDLNNVKRNIQGIIDRLSVPKSNALLANLVSTPTKRVPNTYTHGIHSLKIRRSVLPSQIEFGSPLSRRSKPN